MTLTVEATATIDGQQMWMDVGLGRIVQTPGGKKIRMKLGAVPDEREFYVSVIDVLRLEAQDDPDEGAVLDGELCGLPH